MTDWWISGTCCECGKRCRTVEGFGPSRCRACLLFREVYPLFDNMSPNIEMT